LSFGPRASEIGDSPNGRTAASSDYRDVLAEITQVRLNNPAVEAIFPEHSLRFMGIVG
jgi:hypothetical protein